MRVRFPTLGFRPDVPMTTLPHTPDVLVADVGVTLQLGSPMMSNWYLAKSEAVIAVHCAPVTTVVVNPALRAANSSRLMGLPPLSVMPVAVVTVSPLMSADLALYPGGVACAPPPPVNRATPVNNNANASIRLTLRSIQFPSPARAAPYARSKS